MSALQRMSFPLFTVLAALLSLTLVSTVFAQASYDLRSPDNRIENPNPHCPQSAI